MKGEVTAHHNPGTLTLQIMKDTRPSVGIRLMVECYSISLPL